MIDEIRRILLELGEDPSRDGLVKTPQRVDAAMKQVLLDFVRTLSTAAVHSGRPSHERAPRRLFDHTRRRRGSAI